MSSYDAIRPGAVIVNGKELAGTVFQPPATTPRTILDKTRVVNYSDTSFYISIGIIKLGQGIKTLNRLVFRSRLIAPHATLIIEELKGECLDVPSEIFAEVVNAAGVPGQIGNVSISITGTQKRN